MLQQLKEGKYYGENIKAMENDNFKLSITHYAAKAITDRHYHDNAYLSILLNGYYLEDNKADKKIIEPGQILFRPKDYVHQNTFENQGGTCFNIEFKSDWNKELDLSLKLPKHYNHYHTGTFHSLYKLLLDFKTNHYRSDLAKEYLYDWLFEINYQSITTPNLVWLGKIKAILENEINTFHTLNDLAETAHVHPIYLARAFKQKMNTTIGEYQLKAKLSKALHALLNSTQSISDIAFAHGFHDDAHFIKAFKNRHAISPLQFRLKIKS
jgi:AraC family transcriptional regulator